MLVGKRSFVLRSYRDAVNTHNATSTALARRMSLPIAQWKRLVSADVAVTSQQMRAGNEIWRFRPWLPSREWHKASVAILLRRQNVGQRISRHAGTSDVVTVDQVSQWCIVVLPLEGCPTTSFMAWADSDFMQQVNRLYDRMNRIYRIRWGRYPTERYRPLVQHFNSRSHIFTA